MRPNRPPLFGNVFQKNRELARRDTLAYSGMMGEKVHSSDLAAPVDDASVDVIVDVGGVSTFYFLCGYSLCGGAHVCG